MCYYRLTFKANESFVVQAHNPMQAQEIGIELLESHAIPHSEIVGIVRTDAPSVGQFIGTDPEGFAVYIGVAL